jgi:hypothetical protein
MATDVRQREFMIAIFKRPVLTTDLLSTHQQHANLGLK